MSVALNSPDVSQKAVPPVYSAVHLMYGEWSDIFDV